MPWSAACERVRGAGRFITNGIASFSFALSEAVDGACCAGDVGVARDACAAGRWLGGPIQRCVQRTGGDPHSQVAEASDKGNRAV